MDEDKKFLKLAIEQARKSIELGGFPAGAVLVKNGKVISATGSIGFKEHDPSAHAESKAIRNACLDLATSDLTGATLYGSMESCNMCFSTAFWAGVTRIVYAAAKTPEMVAKSYYEGATSNKVLNESNGRNMEIVHIPDLEEAALNVLAEWQKLGGFNRQ